MRRYFPNAEEFAALAKDAEIVPVYRQLLADRITPVTAFEVLGRDDHAFLLESVVGGEKIGRYSFIATAPSVVYQAMGGTAMVQYSGREARTFKTADPLADLQEMIRGEVGFAVRTDQMVRTANPTSSCSPALPSGAGPGRETGATGAPARYHQLKGLPAFTGGLVGYASYDLIRYYEGEKLTKPPRDDRRLPDACFGLYNELVIFDHVDKTVKVVANADLRRHATPAAAHADACRRIDDIVARLSQPPLSSIGEIDPTAPLTLRFESNFSREAFEQAVRAGKEFIKAGDIFQFVPSQRLRVPSHALPFDVYRALRIINPSPYMFFLKNPSCTLIGSSPEILCSVHGREITSRPLAGTRRRGSTDEEDKRLELELLADPKERAEHIMLVDLHRNDVGRVAKTGSVKISEVLTVERYSHVMHIVTNVRGELRDDLSALDALRVSLPVGTVSGAPKIRAMQIIDELEPTRRGPYGGAVGYVDFAGNMDTCIALRTMVYRNGTYDVQAGAGVVADSDPASEWEETMNKAKAMLKAVEIAEKGF